jgi:Cactus-binding C-terminus of cactin protein/Conserved mid region of cactin
MDEEKKNRKEEQRDNHPRKRRKQEDSGDDDSESEEKHRRDRKDRSRHRKREKKSHRERHSRKKHRRRDSSRSDSESSSDSSESEPHNQKTKVQLVANERLLQKLAARNETLEERQARRAQARATLIESQLGYTADNNPFNDPNLHETFTWKKKREAAKRAPLDANHAEDADGGTLTSGKSTLEEIEKVRQRRKQREEQLAERERIRAEESRLKEYEHYDDWVQKEEEFHLQQQRHRSAIRLVDGREKPIDVLAKNLFIFGLSDAQRKQSFTKYQERYNAMDAVDALEVELEEPYVLLKMLKLQELEELLRDIEAFRLLEREAGGSSTNHINNDGNAILIRYWDNLHTVTVDEIDYLKSDGETGPHAKMIHDVVEVFQGQSLADLGKMKDEIESKLHNRAEEGYDGKYWTFVRDQIFVHMAKAELSELHAKMLVRQLERLEKKKEELARNPSAACDNDSTQVDNTRGEPDRSEETQRQRFEHNQETSWVPENVPPEFGDLEEELGLSGEVDLEAEHYQWQDRYRPRKPRYFNRVKSGYDWSKYNQTHYDKDNPPPKVVQGYKFNIFYPDLIDPTKTPQYKLEAADSDEYCIIRFHAGPPYEDIAFKIVNREWNRSRKRGFKCTFERGVLSLYFSFTTHWYRK